MDYLFGSFGAFILIFYLVLFIALLGLIYWAMKHFKQMVRVNEVKELILREELNKIRVEKSAQSSSSKT